MKGLAVGLILIVAIFLAFGFYHARAHNMLEIKVDIGKNIVETTKNSGAPRFGRESHWGLEIYELVNLRPEVTVLYSRPGFEIAATPLFALTLYADSENQNNMAVEKIELQYNYEAKTHKEAKAFVANILQQFKRGKWKRHIDETCPAVSGRSSYLDEAGNIVYDSCALDPYHDPTMEDWTQVMSMVRSYEWLGDGIFARLNVGFSEDSRGLTYNIDLEFCDYEIDRRRMDAQQTRELIEGDKKGWKSTEDFNRGMAENKMKVKLLEGNAVRRGDHLVPRD